MDSRTTWKEEEMRLWTSWQRSHPVCWPCPAPETAALPRLLLSCGHCEGERSDFPSALTPPRTNDLRGSLLNYVGVLPLSHGKSTPGISLCVSLSCSYATNSVDCVTSESWKCPWLRRKIITFQMQPFMIVLISNRAKGGTLITNYTGVFSFLTSHLFEWSLVVGP